MDILLERTYKPTMADLAAAQADLESALADIPPRAQMIVAVAADEIIANIVRYSQAKDWTLRATRDESSVSLVFTDDGVAFDPLVRRDPDTTLAAGERAVGGLGILIVKKTMSPVTYERRDGRNVLTMGLSL